MTQKPIVCRLCMGAGTTGTWNSPYGPIKQVCTRCRGLGEEPTEVSERMGA